jgi:hypothetical protein
MNQVISKSNLDSASLTRVHIVKLIELGPVASCAEFEGVVCSTFCEIQLVFSNNSDVRPSFIMYLHGNIQDYLSP